MGNIVVDLDNSLYAHGFNSDGQIHQYQMNRAINIIRQHYELINGNDKKDDCIYIDHRYQTISILGDRGSGKTSFLISLLEKCKEEFQEIEILRIIDPTLVEYQKPMILCIISMINQLVEIMLEKKECSLVGDAFNDRMRWTKALKRVSIGMPAVDVIGKTYYEDPLWQDEEYVLHTGLSKVNEANKFEENLRAMIREALNILGKKAFIISFDDIDVDINKGWNVLETLRRYLSDIHVISIVSGNFKLYEMLIKKNLCQQLSIKDKREKSIMENELGGQYMLKLLPPANRINLQSLHNLIQPDNTILVKYNASKFEPKDIVKVYTDILKTYRIEDISSQQLFKEFLLSMSLRTQLHFIKDALDVSSSELPLAVFASRLYDRGIDMEILKANAQLTNLVIFNYLRNRGELSECYLLLPTMADKDSNSILTALTFVECGHFKKYPFLIFDYMLRIGYIRNLILSLDSPEEIEKLCKYGGWSQVMSLKNNIGLTMAYVAGKQLGNMKEHIELFGLEATAKKTVKNSLDGALKSEELSPIQRLLASFPFLSIIHSKNNESQNFYSPFAILGIIGEILKRDDEDSMIECINDLKLFRSYQMPQDKEYYPKQNSSYEENISLVEVDQNGVKELAKLMKTWKTRYTAYTTYIPPYIVGRIITRFYATSKNIIEKSVGKRMNIMVASFFNACLVEEARITIKPMEQSQINNNNPRTTTSVFTDNLKKTDIVNQLNFTKWIISCPMLNCFLDQETWDKVNEFVRSNRENIYDILVTIESKDVADYINGVQNEKKSFSGEKTMGWKKTALVLLNNGLNADIIKNSILEAPIESAITFIKNKGLFDLVYKSSVESFRHNCKYEDLLSMENELSNQKKVNIQTEVEGNEELTALHNMM